MFAIELEFLPDNPKWFLAHLTLYSPVQDIIWYSLYSIWEFTCWYNLRDSRKWGFIITPIEEWSVEECSVFLSFRACPGIHVSDTLDSCIRRNDRFTSKRIVLICYRLIIPKWTQRGWKELSPLSVRYHLLYNTRNHLFIFFFGVLAIENAVGFIADSGA
jgi:hypothetical protein